MPVWQKTKPTNAAVTLASGSDSDSSSNSHTNSNSYSQSIYSQSQLNSHSQSASSYHYILPPKPTRRASVASLPTLGVGIGVGSHSSLLASFARRQQINNNINNNNNNREMIGDAMMATQKFSRTHSNPEFISTIQKDYPVYETQSTQDRYSPMYLLQGDNKKKYKNNNNNNKGIEVMRILVLGAPQVGKSSLVNSYRAAVTNNNKWPAAPVGICGFCGTTTIDPFPNHPTEPTWLCIDTPGKFYDENDNELLKKLFHGVPWKSRIAGKNALLPAEIQLLPIIHENRAHQCIIVVPATDLIEDNGWTSVFQLKSRYSEAADVEGVIVYLRNLVFLVRSFLYDASPFVVVTKMDLIGGTGNINARRLIISLLSRCIPVNRLYFCACPGDQSSHETKCLYTLDRDTRENLLRLHEDLSLTFRWRRSIEESV